MRRRALLLSTRCWPLMAAHWRDLPVPRAAVDARRSVCILHTANTENAVRHQLGSVPAVPADARQRQGRRLWRTGHGRQEHRQRPPRLHRIASDDGGRCGCNLSRLKATTMLAAADWQQAERTASTALRTRTGSCRRPQLDDERLSVMEQAAAHPWQRQTTRDSWLASV